MSVSNAIWRPFTQMKTAPSPLLVEKAAGARLYLDDGKSVLDGISSWWVITHGHCRKEIMQAIGQQAQEIDQVIFSNFSHRPAQELVNLLSQLLPSSLSKFFFTDNGSTAVEAALKMTMQRWHQLGEKDRKRFLTFEKSYHGDTIGAMSVGGRGSFNEVYDDYLFEVTQLRQGHLSTDSLESYTAHFLEVIEKDHQQLAGIIIEPLIQGAGGMIMWPLEALELIGAKARQFAIPLIFDEVMTGFGRTGSLFAFHQLSFSPDFLCLSKGLTGGSLPLSLTITTQEVYEAFYSDQKEKMFLHGHSFTGNPIACAAAVANIKLMKSEKMTEQWRRIERIHRERIMPLGPHPYVRDVRVCGVVGAVEIETSRSGYLSSLCEKVMAFAMARGVFLRPLGNVIYILPPYCIENDELHRIWDVVEDVIGKSDLLRDS